jgi:hypothetical protein
VHLHLFSKYDGDLEEDAGTATIKLLTATWYQYTILITAESKDLWNGKKQVGKFSPNIYEITFGNEKKAPAGIYPITFSAIAVPVPNLEIQQIIEVEVQSSDNPPPPPPPPGGTCLLNCGHPIEGINYRRNNRSTYNLPTYLGGDDWVDAFKYLFISNVPVEELLIGKDETLFIAYEESFGGSSGAGWGYISEYHLASFRFDDEKKTIRDGGLQSILIEDGVLATDYRYYESTFVDGFVYEFTKTHFSYIYLYSLWPELAAEVCEYWGSKGGVNEFGAYGYKTGNWKGRFFQDIFPLPDGRILAAYRKPVWAQWEITQLQLLNEDLEVIKDFSYSEPITGFAYDMNKSITHVTTEGGHYLYDEDFNEFYHDIGSSPPYPNEWYPVITDDGGILVCFDGVLRKVEPDGTGGPEFDCDIFQPPVILNDGTIVALTYSSLLYFDEQLNHIGGVPLPSGSGTGESYTRSPLVDANDNMALFVWNQLYIINREGDIISHRELESDIVVIRLGPEHLYVALEEKIYRFPG